MKTGFILTVIALMPVGALHAQQDSTQSTGTGWSDYFTYDINLSSILISCLLMFLLYMLWGRRKQKSSHNKYKYLNPGSEMANYGYSNTDDFDLLKNRIKFLEGEVSQLKEEIRKLASKVESSKIPMEVIVAGGTETPVKQRESNQRPGKQPEPPAASPAFFLSTPNSDGSFNNSSANTTYKEGASIYKFMNTKEKRAKFWIDERDASIKLALAYPDKNIDPVCDAMNAFDPRARKIYTQVPGDAELVGDKWMVVTKAKIRYES